MDRRNALFATASGLAGGMLLTGRSAPVGAQPAAGLRQKLIGVWTLAATYNILPDGKRFEPLGPEPKGQLALDAGGRFGWILLRPDIPKVQSNNRLTATAEENSAVARGTLAYFGTWSVNEADSAITLKIEYSSFANLNATAQTRTLKLEGDQLTIINPAGPTGGTAYVIWKRVA